MGSSKGAKLFYELLYDGQRISRDAPDMVCLNGATALIIEHFEFDCYRAGKKGSKNKQEQARISKQGESLEIPEDGLVYTDTIHGKSSYEDYIKNLTVNFNSHYKKIEAYKQNLLNDGLITPETNIKVSFLIEDVSPLPCTYKERMNESMNMKPIELAHSPEFLALFENSPELDYVLSCSTTSDGHKVWFIDRNEISFYKNEVVNYKNKEFIAHDAKVTRVSYIIKKD